MKKIIILLVIIFLVTLLVPLGIYLNVGKYEEPPQEAEDKLLVYIKEEDRVCEMNKSQYLKEVVAAEMPASFEPEALKAQAVAARSYLESRRAVSTKDSVHKGGEICTDSTHCKAWVSEAKRRESWGNGAETNWEKISCAVEETADEVMVFEDEVISAVFHSTSSGMTESSKDVWGGDRPYLVSVESPGDKLSPKYKSERILTLSEFKEIASQNIEGVDFTKGLISDIKRSEAGGILTAKIGGKDVKGTQIRSMFSLRSTNAEITITDNEVKFDVSGYGHGVGMSQYGANYFAVEGKNYEEILKTYYQGVEIVKLNS